MNIAHLMVEQEVVITERLMEEAGEEVEPGSWVLLSTVGTMLDEAIENGTCEREVGSELLVLLATIQAMIGEELGGPTATQTESLATERLS